jgi:hypothetical protein
MAAKKRDGTFVDVDITDRMRPMVRRNGEVIDRKITARGLFLEAQDAWRIHADRRYGQALLNERFISGDQQWGLDAKRGPSELVVEWPAWLPRTQRNLLRNLHMTNVARVTKGDPSIKAWGGDGSPMDVGAADVANALIYSMRNSNDHRKVISRAGWTCGAQGAAAFYTTWDPGRGPVGVDGVTRLGDVCVEQLQIFDWMSDGSEDIEDSEYVMVRRWMKPDDAHARLLEVGDDIPEPKGQAIKTVWGDGMTRVEAWEYWHRPCPNIPRGLFALFIAGHAVEVTDFPYQHGELPVSVWKWADLPDSPLGATPCDDAVPLQAQLNRLHSSLALLTSKAARWTKVITSPAIAKAWNADSQVIGVTSMDEVKGTQIIGPPPPPALLYTQIEEAERMLREVYGVNEAVVGSDASQTKNARMLAYVTELDAQKLAPTIVARDHALLRVYRQALKLWRQFVEEERTIRIVGDAGVPAILAFSGAMLDGVDVYLEPAAGQDQTKSANALDAEQAAAAGMMDPTRAAEMRQTGQTQTRFEALARTLVQRQIADALGGFAAQPDPSIPPDIAVSELEMAIQANAGNMMALQPLMALLAAYKQQMQAAMAPQQTPQEVTPQAPQEDSIT